MLEVKELNAYKLYLFRKGCKENTIKRRIWNLQNVLKQTEFAYDDVDAFLLKMLQSGKKAKYINSIVDSIRTYAQYAGIDALKHYKDFKEEPTVKSTMSDDEIEAFLALPCPVRHCISKFGKPFTRSIGEKVYEQHTMFFTLCAHTGARMGEIAKLSVDDVLWGQDCISIKNDKTGKNRLVPIAPNIREKLKAYVDKLKQPYLFKAGNSSGFMNSVTWGDAFHKRINRLGIKRKGLTPYSLRHSFITALLEEDVNIFKVQKIVGHSRLETTNIYYQMTTKDIKAAIKKLPLVKKNADPHIALEHIKEAIRSLSLQDDGRFEFEFSESRDGLSLHVKLKQ